MNSTLSCALFKALYGRWGNKILESIVRIFVCFARSKIKIVKIYLSAFLLLAHSLLFSQSVLIVGNKSYPATDEEYFPLKSDLIYSGTDNLSIVIAKNQSEGLIRIGIKAYDLNIRGVIIIYLEDGNQIACYDKGKYDNVDGYSYNIYNLTADEIQKLMMSNIYSIRFRLMCGKCLGNEDGNGDYSALNISVKNMLTHYEKIDVPLLIRNLF